MAKIASPPPTNTPKPSSTAPPKLSRLPKGTHIHKRPLLHPPLASTRSGPSTPKIIYLSSNTPFIATVKRVRAYLDAIDARAATSSGQKMQNRAKQRGAATTKRSGAGKAVEEERAKEEVHVKATGKAIERALRVALHFQELGDVYRVVMRTGSVGAVDDVVVPGVVGDGDGDEEEGGAGKGVREETRVRRTSMLEVIIWLR